MTIEQMTIELEGTVKGLRFKAEGHEHEEIVGVLTLHCHPNEIEAGRLSRLMGKDVLITISSRQIELPMKERP